MVRSDPLPPTPDDIEHVLDFIAEDNPDAAQIERLAPRELRRRPRRPKDRPKHADEREANRGRGSHSPFGGRSESPAIRNAAHRQQGRTAPWEQRAIDIVRGHLERQAGEAVAAEYEVERSQNGLRVHVQFLQLDEEGQAFTYPGGSCTVRLSPEGKVIEVVSGRG